MHLWFVQFSDRIFADGVRPIPGQQVDATGDTEMFLFVGFMILPILFILYGIYQRFERRRIDISQVKLLISYSQVRPEEY
jgi:hypothetical protein